MPTVLTVDADLSLSASLGGDVGLAVGIDDCSQIAGPATAIADGIVLATLDEPEPLIFGTGKRFIITVPGASIDTATFGLPAVVPIVVQAICDGKQVQSSVYTLSYVPTLGTIVAPSTVSRFWPSDIVGETLVCSGNSLIRYDASGTTQGDPVDLGFTCTGGELQGDLGGRRFFTVANGGVAALDPGPTLAWSRHSSASHDGLEAVSFLYDAGWFRTDQDAVLQFREVAQGTTYVILVDYDTGLDKSPRMPTVHQALGAVTRDPSGNIGVLTAEGVGVEIYYYTEYFDTSAIQLRDPVLVSHYPSGTPYAEFSYDGTRIYLPATDGEGNDWIQAATLEEGTITELTGGQDGWNQIMGEAYGRLLVRNSDVFVWLDTSTGATLSQTFAPDSGSGFLRLRVESDGTTVMLGDTLGSGSANGFYIFAEDGSDIIRLHGEQAYSWLTESWDGGSLVSIDDGSGNIQMTLSGAGYVALPH